MEQLDNFAIRIGMKNLSVENFKMVFGGMNQFRTIKGQGYISIDGKMEQYESPCSSPWR